MKIPVIIDVDTGIDDGVALLLAFKSNKLDIKFIATCNGNTTAQNSARNTLNLLEFVKLPNIPIVIGEETGFKKTRTKVSVHGNNGFGDYKFQKSNYKPLEDNCVEYYAKTLLQSKKPITIIALGPLSNIAKLIKKHPQTISKIKEIYFMGSSLSQVIKGIIPYAGFNVACDPEATEYVLKSGIKMIFCPNDMGKICYLIPNEVEYIKNINYVGKMLVDVFGKYKDRQVVNGIAMYDSTTIYSIIEPNNINILPVHIDVKYYSELNTGVALANFHKTPNAYMIMNINTLDFKRYCLKALKSFTE